MRESGSACYFYWASQRLAWYSLFETSPNETVPSVKRYDFSSSLVFSDGPRDFSANEMCCLAAWFDVGEAEDAFFWFLGFWSSCIAYDDAFIFL